MAHILYYFAFKVFFNHACGVSSDSVLEPMALYCQKESMLKDQMTCTTLGKL